MTNYTDLIARLQKMVDGRYATTEEIQTLAALEAAQAENAQWRVDFKEMVIERDAALARLAEIESTHIDEVMNGLMLEKSLANLKAQEPVGTVDRTAPGFVAWVSIPKLKDGSKLFASAGASPAEVKALQDEVADLTDSRDFYKRRVDLLQQWQSKMRDPERTICCDIIANGQTLPPENAGNRYSPQPSQAQPPAPSEAAITYMTGYSDCKEWAGATSQAQPSQADAQDAARYRWIRLGKPYRVVVDAPTKKKPDAKITIMASPSPESDYARALDAAIDAAINAKGAV